MTPPIPLILPQQGADPFDVDAFIAAQETGGFDVDAFVADSVPFDVEAFVADQEARIRPTRADAAQALAATPRGPLPRELQEFGAGVDVVVPAKPARLGGSVAEAQRPILEAEELGRTVRLPSPLAVEAPLIGGRGGEFRRPFQFEGTGRTLTTTPDERPIRFPRLLERPIGAIESALGELASATGRRARGPRTAGIGPAPRVAPPPRQRATTTVLVPETPPADILAFSPPALERDDRSLQPDQQPSDASNLLAGALEANRRRRAARVALFSGDAEGGSRVGEAVVTAGETLTDIAQLSVRLPAAALGLRDELEATAFGVGPARKREELEAAGLRFQPEITGLIEAGGDPLAAQARNVELPGPARALLTPLGLKTEADLAGFLGSLPLIAPVFKAAGTVAKAAGTRASRTLSRGIGPAVAIGAPRALVRLPGAVSGGIELGGTVGGGGGILSGAEAASRGEGFAGIVDAATRPLIHETFSVMNPDLFNPSFTLLGALKGLVKRPPFAATVSSAERDADLRFRLGVFRKIEADSPLDQPKQLLELEMTVITETVTRHRDIMDPRDLRALEARHAMDLAILKPPKGALTPFDTPEVLEARRQFKTQIQTELLTTAERMRDRQRWLETVYGEGARLKQRRVVIILGPPAAGKSRAMADRMVIDIGGLLADADLFKPLIPEFNNGRGAGVVHVESAALNQQLIVRAMEAGDNIVMPRVGKDLAGMLSDIRDFHEAGYTIDLKFVDLPIQKAAARAITRFYQEGRFVDPNYVLNEVDGFPLRTFEAVKNDPRISTYERVNNNVLRGIDPITVDQGFQRGGSRADGAAGLRGAAPARRDPGRSPANPGTPAAAVLARRLESIREAHAADPAAGSRLAGLARQDLATDLRLGRVTLAEAQRLDREIRQFETDLPLDVASQLLRETDLSTTVQNSIMLGLNELGTRVTRDLLAEAKGDAAIFAKAAGEAIGREAGLNPGLIMNERGSVRLGMDELQANPDMSGLPEHSRAIQAVLRIGLNDRSLPTMGDIYTALVRRTFGLESFEREISGASDLPASASPGAAARLAAGSSRRSEGFLEIGPAQWDAQGNLVFSGTPSYKQILSAVAAALRAAGRGAAADPLDRKQLGVSRLKAADERLAKGGLVQAGDAPGARGLLEASER